MNATQARLAETLDTLGKPVHAWPGHLTMANRVTTGLGKSHTLDALAVGHLDHEAGDAIVRFPERVLVAEGHRPRLVRLSVRARGQHSLSTTLGRFNVRHWNLRLLQRGDGYGYSTRPELTPPASPKNS
ncbi:hypothetical protein [Streptomyces sp. NPDC093223]|uniref:hypothetical protein n=1 Tax=Streptomyces sp. NPDC093223 TaxID=3366033 RepID=UPI00382B964B